ncbi:uncharacterized protein LOC129378078 [Poeciliopsis prolifica]|uniref:uncharacterized protein LOC129378078 n=1 Tax=Poeciliopsis prolifica TaxID=188132 RepID=UPI00241460F2|nr:uncharacterized protein LOC129378078 [Poeciliopsis prolifica]
MLGSHCFLQSCILYHKGEETDYLDKAIEDLRKAQESLKYLNEECMICLQFVKMSSIDTANSDPTPLDKQLTTKCNMYDLFGKNIDEAIEKLDEIQKKGRDALAKKSSVFSFISLADEALQEEAYILYNRGLKYVFAVEEKPRFCWEGLLVFCLGILQIIGGTLLTAFTVGTLAQIGIGLISEGLSDCTEGITAMIKGEFSWKEWGIGKAISIGVSILSFGVGKIISKGFKAAKAAIKAIGKKLKPLPKFLSNQAKNGLSTVTKTNMKNALKLTAKKIVEKAASYGLGKAEEKLLEQILKGIKNEVTKGITEKVKSKLEEEPLVNSIILSHVEDREQLCDLLNNEEKRKKLQDIFVKYSNTSIEPLRPDLRWEDKFNSSLTEILDSAVDEAKKAIKVAKLNNDSARKCSLKKTNLVLKAIQVTHYAALAADAIHTVSTMLGKFFSNFEKELDIYKKEVLFSEKQNSLQSRIFNFFNKKITLTDLTSSDTELLSAFKQDLAETISGLLADALVEVFHQKFSSHMVSIAHKKVNQFISSTLNTDRTNAKLTAGQNNSYIAHMPLDPGSTRSANPCNHSNLHAVKIKNPETPGTIFDVRVLSEATATKVIIHVENKHGQLTKLQEIIPGSKATIDTVALIYRPRSTNHPNGHYDVLINNKIITIDSKDKSSLFHAFARGNKPDANETTISSEAVRLRSVEADTLLKNPSQWEPFAKRKKWMEKIRGGDWYMAEADGPERKIEENRSLLRKAVDRLTKKKSPSQESSTDVDEPTDLQDLEDLLHFEDHLYFEDLVEYLF